MSGLLKREGMRQLLPAMLDLLFSEIAVKMNNLLLCPLRLKDSGLNDYSLIFPILNMPFSYSLTSQCQGYTSSTFSCSFPQVLLQILPLFVWVLVTALSLHALCFVHCVGY